MNSTKKEIFESELYQLLKYTESDSEDFKLLKDALERLTDHPEIFVGDPNGIFTYEDTVLAGIAFVFHQSEMNKLPKLVASKKWSGIAENSKIVSNSDWVDWAFVALHAFKSSGDKSFNELKNKTPQNPITVDKIKIRFAVIGDAGFNGTVQAKLLDKIKKRHQENPFDFLIHLGDIYFGGSQGEMLHNFLSPFKQVETKIYTLMGNHDLYYGGVPFMDVMNVLNQPGRFFSIENKHWIIACLDTSLPSTSISRLDGELDKEQIIWLKGLIKDNSEKKLILMSHHYIDSGWSKGSEKLRRQIQPFIPSIFSWYWGHEHNCARYDKTTLGYYGACLGNGVFMEKWSEPTTDRMPEWYPKGFCECTNGNFSEGWQHGFLELELSEDGLLETYHIEHEKYPENKNRTRSILI
jgi:predicted phosphodiesterase